MSAWWYWQGRLGGALLLTASGLMVWALASPTGPLRTQAQAHGERLKRDLAFVRATASPELVLGVQAMALLVAALCALFRLWAPALIATAIAASPGFALRALRHKRVLLIDQQVEAWLVALANALKASPSLGESLASTTALLREPIVSEIDRIVKEHQLGTPLDQAFDNAAARVGSRAFTMALTMLRIARNTGGDLPETLAVSAKSLREMARLDGVLRTKTAEGKAQALVVSCVPAPLYFVISWIYPGFFDPLKHSFTGHIVVAIAGLLWISAALLAQRILKVDL